MATQIEVPPLGESVKQAILVAWHKKEGESVATDEPICELETDKANVDLPAPAAGDAVLRAGAPPEIDLLGEDVERLLRRNAYGHAHRRAVAGRTHRFFALALLSAYSLNEASSCVQKASTCSTHVRRA